MPDGVRFVRDDVTVPDRSMYAGAVAVYALNLPPELYRTVLEITREIDSEFLFTTFVADQPAIPVERETLADDPLFRTRVDGPESG